MKGVLALLSLLLLGELSPPVRPAPTGGLPPVRGAFFAISVPDLAASAHWYAETFGLHATVQVPHANGVAVTILEGNGLIVELLQHDGAMPLTSAAPGVHDPMMVHGPVKAGFIVDDFDAALATLRSHRVEIAYGPYSARPPQHANVIIRDNAGNLIQLFGR